MSGRYEKIYEINVQLGKATKQILFEEKNVVASRTASPSPPTHTQKLYLKKEREKTLLSQNSAISVIYRYRLVSGLFGTRPKILEYLVGTKQITLLIFSRPINKVCFVWHRYINKEGQDVYEVNKTSAA